jgi:hypothetical protein
MELTQADPYTSAPLAVAVGKANRAARFTEAASAVAAEAGREFAEAAEAARERTLRLAALTAHLNRADRGAEAEAVAEAAEAEAARVREFDAALFQGVGTGTYTEPGAEATEVAAQVAEAREADTRAEACGADPDKRASAGRYNKGCRCEACKAAVAAYRARKRA